MKTILQFGFVLLLTILVIPANANLEVGHNNPNVKAVDEGSIADAIEFAALKDLYDNLGGLAWTNKNNWPTTWPTSATSAEFGTWFGITVTNGDITGIDLKNNNLVGMLPASIGDMGSLIGLELSVNKIKGPIPPAIGKLINITYLDLNGNQLTGTLPIEIGSLVKLEYLYLTGNQLSGVIPDIFNKLSNLYDCQLQGNLLSGPVPSTISGLTNVRYLYLHNNKLSGSLPAELGNLLKLAYLRLENNQFTGTLPDFSKLTLLAQIIANDNQLIGPLLSSNFNTGMVDFQIARNRFTGPFPDISTWHGISSIVINDNAFTGPFPSVANLNQIKLIRAWNNQFSSMPSAVISLTLAGPVGFHFENNKIKSITSLESDYANNNIHPAAGLVLIVANNQLDFSQLEILTKLGIPTLSYSPQKNISDFTTGGFFPGSSLVIQARNPGQNSTITWEKKQLDNTWLNVNNLNQDPSQKTFTRTIGAASDVGVYRWSMTNSQVTGLTLQSDPITIGSDGVVPDAIEFAALKDLYDSLGGLGWTNKTNWPTTWPTSATSAEFGTWFGVTVTNGDVTSISLANNNLIGEIPASIGDLKKISSLALNDNQLSGNIPSEVGNLPEIAALNLYKNKLSGTIPSTMGNLQKLMYIYLWDNKLTGSIPPELKKCIGLREFVVGNNQLEGDIPDLRNILGLNYLGVNNNKFSGAVPEWIGHAPALWNLFLNNNQFTGNLPVSFNELSKIINLIINDNQLTGSLPDLGNATQLNTINASNNRFTNIPASILNLSTVTIINISENEFVSIPNFSNQVNKSNLTLALSNNKLDFSNLEPLMNVGIKVVGYVPQKNISDFTTGGFLLGKSLVIQARNPGQNSTITWEKQQADNTWLNVNTLNQDASQKTFSRTVGAGTDVGVYRWSMTNSQVTVLTLQSDPITIGSDGAVPDGIEFAALKDLYDSLTGGGWTNKNNWPTTWPASATSAEFGTWFGVTVTNGDVTNIGLSSNNLKGIIPESIGNLQALQYLYLHVNPGITGDIPSTLGNIQELQELFLNQCNLTGTLPSTIFNLTKLQYLILSTNKISGTIPTNIGNATALYNLSLGSNNLSGTIPTTLSNLPNLGSLSNLGGLSLANNKLTGSIPPSLGSLSTLTNLDISTNQFTGSIPDELYNLTKLTRLGISSNQISGALSPLLSKLTKMQYLNLTHNLLSGPIPSELSSLAQLEILILDNNQFSGLLPPLSNLTRLITLDLNHNRLTGALPNLSTCVNLSYLSVAYNDIISTQNFSNHVNKANLDLFLDNNKLDFSSLEPLINTGIKSVLYAPQKNINDFTTSDFLPGSSLVIQARNPGQNSTITWEKQQADNTWLNVNTLNQDATQKTFTRTIGAGTDVGVYRWSMINTIVTGFTLQSAPIITTEGSIANPQWINLVNVTITGNTITKTSGQNLYDAGAFSVQSIAANKNGWVEFSTDEPMLWKMMGLSVIDLDVDYKSIDYALAVGDNSLYIYEQGQQRTGPITSCTATDILRVERQGSTIVYKKNGVVFYTSAVPTTQSLHADCTIKAYTSFKNIKIFSEGGGYDLYSEAVFLENIHAWKSADAVYSNVGATPDKSGCDTTSFHNVWFAFQATTNELEIKVLYGGDKGTLNYGALSLFDTSGNQVKCDYNSSGAQPFLQLTSLVPDSIYYFSVDNYDGNPGTFSLAINDEFTNNFISNAQLIPDITSWTSEDAAYNNNNATPDFSGSPCGGPYHNVWYKFQAVGNSIGVLVTSGGSKGTLQYPLITLFGSDSIPVACKGAFQSAIIDSTSVTPGAWYYLSVDNYQGGTGTFTLQIKNSSDSIPIACTPTYADEYHALMALYSKTKGPAWTNNTGWRDANPNVVQSFAGWYGVETDAKGHVINLVLENNNLTETIPSDIGRITSLHKINFQNNHLKGPIPSEIGNLACLQELWLNNNQLDSMPASLGNLTELSILNLHDNALKGIISDALGKLTNLNRLELQDNNLSGGIPLYLSRLINLKLMDLSRNKLEGIIPRSLGNISGLTSLLLADNKLTGPIPPTFKSLTALTELDLSKNLLTDPIPAWLGNLHALKHLLLNNNALSDGVPSTLSGLVNLERLQLNNNQLTGGIEFISSLTKLTNLVINDNGFTGAVPSLNQLQNLQYFWANNNYLVSISSEVLNLPSLQSLKLSNNKLRFLPNFITHVNKSNLELTIDQNYLTFTHIAPLINGGLRLLVYNPQNVVDDEKSVKAQIGESLTLTTSIDRSTTPLSKFQWFKVVADVETPLNSSAENGHTVIISAMTQSDVGTKYIYKISNPASEMVLKSNPQIFEPVICHQLSGDFQFERANGKFAFNPTLSTLEGVCVKSYLWDFGDGVTSTESNPNHAYTSPGNYSINLNVSYSCEGCPTSNLLKQHTLSIDKSFCGIYCDGNGLGIGTTQVPSGYLLAVKGKVIMEGAKVSLQSTWPDYVFEREYKIMEIQKLKEYIATHSHLPDMPSAETVKNDGIDIGEMNSLLLKKIEELTLYMIQLDEQVKILENK